MAKKTTTNNEITVANAFPMISSFTIKATIPTGAYANIQPEIVVNDVTFEDIENVIMPKIDEMFIKYHNFSDNIKNIPTAPKSTVPVVPVVQNESPAFITAKNALTSAKSPEAKLAVQQQISMSKKLTKYEIEKLLAM